MSSLHSEELSKAEIAKRGASSIVKLVVYIVVYVGIAAIVQWIFTSFLPQYGINISDYIGYVQILLALAFGYLIVNSVATFFYWSIRGRYEHSTAAAIRNIIRIIGIGALISAIAGGVAGGAAGVALGGFLGMVIGFASQQVLGQAVAGLFLLISRPFRIGDEVVIAGEEGTVEDISTLFTTIVKKDGSKVIMPNNSILGGKIYLKSISSK
ncbi:MAG: mechanosensitive ion channel family protein [Aigarchaeota archaeon]|nr:mechanosensitive ion channel family protein [Aigarchaeota archaeon]MCX8193055.1 mechanosensitive ion channel family protein [Nitrososphaeria archaeon]MDW7986207.1 mechanosensitive ion channel [Nitrososphaerota archaeon]